MKKKLDLKKIESNKPLIFIIGFLAASSPEVDIYIAPTGIG